MTTIHSQGASDFVYSGEVVPLVTLIKRVFGESYMLWLHKAYLNQTAGLKQDLPAIGEAVEKRDLEGLKTLLRKHRPGDEPKEENQDAA